LKSHLSSTFVASILIACLAETGPAATTDAVKCEAARLKLAANYASCTLRAEATALVKGTTADLATCAAKYDEKCAAVAAKFGAECPSPGDCGSIRELAQCASDSLPVPTGPVTTVAMNDEHLYFTGAVNRRSVDVHVAFPALAIDYSSVVMHFALHCPVGGCDQFDRRGSVSVVQSPGASEVPIEISRFETPFGVGASWDVDVTDLRPLLDGTRTIRVAIDTWVGPGSSYGTGWLVDVSFEFTPGTPVRRAIAAVPVFTQHAAIVGDPNQPISGQVPPASVGVPVGASSLELRSFVTGHGQGNADNCAEFCSRQHTLNVDGSATTNTVWRTDCATTAAPGQGGTSQYSRAGWCPGAVVRDWTFEIPLPGDGIVNVGYEVEAYENTCRPDAPVCAGCILGTGCPYDGGAHTEPFYDVSTLLIAYE